MKTTPTPPTHETIAGRAYLLWEQAGRPAGRDQEFWLHAEQQLQTEAVLQALPLAPPPRIPQSPAHAVPPVIRATAQPVARPPTPESSKKRRPR